MGFPAFALVYKLSPDSDNFLSLQYSRATEATSVIHATNTPIQVHFQPVLRLFDWWGSPQ